MYANEFSKLWYKLSQDMRLHMESQLLPSLTEGQLNVLEFLMANPKVKPSDFIEFLATTPAAITTLLDRMEKNEFIVRERDERDRRIVWIRLTALGIAEGKRGSEIREQFLESSLNKLSSHNQKLLLYLLGKISMKEEQSEVIG
jgi:DNA-binding MarR family transcriptional regulator